MAKNPVGFQVTDATAGWNGSDFDDLFVRKDCFLEGGLWVWGRNFKVTGEFNNLGNNTNIHRSSPVQTISGGTNWKSVSVNEMHTAAVKTDGTLWLWGSGVKGGLGNNSIVDRSSPVQTISAGTDWNTVSTGTYHTAAIKTDGSLWLWGTGASNFATGVLGENNSVLRSSPVQTISCGTSWKSVALGPIHSVAIKTDGTLWSWGCNGGRMGDNTGVNRSSPVQTISGGTNWKQASADYSNTAAVKTDGTLWLFGGNSDGQLGINNRTAVISPVQTLTAGTNWKSVSVGRFTTAAVKTDGTLWIWGGGATSGNLGNNSTINRSSPVQTISGGTDWKTVAVTNYNTAAIKTDGTLWRWGDGFYGSFGNNNTGFVSSPVQTISGGTSWRSLSIGKYNTGAIREDCW